MRTIKYLAILAAFHISSCSAQNKEVIAVTADNKYAGTFFLNEKGLVTRFVNYDSSNSKGDTLTYTYTGTNDVKSISYKADTDPTSFDEETERKYIEDAIYQNTLLEAKGINFPLPFVNSSELGDMAKIFSVSDKYEVNTRVNKKMYRFENLNKKIGFRSNIERYIPNLTTITGFKAVLNKGILVREEFNFQGGILVREYSYDERNRLTKITWDCIYNDDPAKYRETKAFSYLKM